jgi:hypothetical protein
MSISGRTALTLAMLGSATLATVSCDRRAEERRDDVPTRPVDAERAPTDSRPSDPATPAERAPATTDDRSGAGPLDKRTTANDPAIRSIAQARCDREARCNDVGADGKFSTHDACLAEISGKLVDELDLSECPGGVVQKELDECLAEIENESCNNPIDKIERFAACRESDLCKAMIN